MVVWIVLFLFIILLGIMFIREYNVISFLLLNFILINLNIKYWYNILKVKRKFKLIFKNKYIVLRFFFLGIYILIWYRDIYLIRFEV